MEARSWHLLAPQLLKSRLPQREQRAPGATCCCGAAQGRAAVGGHGTPAVGSGTGSMLGIAPAPAAPLRLLQQDVWLAKATGENWHFIKGVCANKTDGEGVYISTHAGSA